MDDHGAGTVSLCSQCGKDLMPGKAFCRHCGAPVPPAPPAAVTACPRCAEPLMAGEPFCPNCGLRVIPLADQPPIPPGQVPIPPMGTLEAPAPEAMGSAELESAERLTPEVPTVAERPEQLPQPIAALTQDALPPLQAAGDAPGDAIPPGGRADAPVAAAPAAGAVRGDEHVESEPPVAATLVAPGLVPLEDAVPDVAANGAGTTAPHGMDVDRVAELAAAARDDSPITARDDSPMVAIEAWPAASTSPRSEPTAAPAGDEAPATHALERSEAAAEERPQPLDGRQSAPGGAEAVPSHPTQQWGAGPTTAPPQAPHQNAPPMQNTPTPPYAPQQNAPVQDTPAQNTPPYVSQQSAPAPRPITPGKYCVNCGAGIDLRAEICPRCGVRQPGMGPVAPAVIYNSGKSKIAAGLLAIFLGPLGIHKFYLGQSGLGIVYLVCTIVSALLWLVLIGIFFSAIIAIVCFVEGIIYLTMSDEAFAAKYDQPRTMVTY